MTQEEKLEKICGLFSLLNDEKQEYILGIMQALTFADSVSKQQNSENPEPHYKPDR